MVIDDLLESSTHAMIVYTNTIQFARGMRVSYPRVLSRMVILCEEGAGTVTVNGRRHTLAENSLLVLPWSHSIHYAADTVDPFLLTGVHIVPWYDPAREPVFAVAHGPDQPHYGAPDRRDRDLPIVTGTLAGNAGSRESTLHRLIHLCVELFHESDFDRPTSNSLARLLLREVARWELARTSGEATARAHPEATPPLAAVETWALEHIHERITVERLARVAGTSISTLRRMFVRTVGAPPYEWLLRQRVRVARELLRTSTLPVREVADAVGIPDPAYFSRLFAARVGCSPREYRRTSLRL